MTPVEEAYRKLLDAIRNEPEIRLRWHEGAVEKMENGQWVVVLTEPDEVQ